MKTTKRFHLFGVSNTIAIIKTIANAPHYRKILNLASVLAILTLGVVVVNGDESQVRVGMIYVSPAGTVKSGIAAQNRYALWKKLCAKKHTAIARIFLDESSNGRLVVKLIRSGAERDFHSAFSNVVALLIQQIHGSNVRELEVTAYDSETFVETGDSTGQRKFGNIILKCTVSTFGSGETAFLPDGSNPVEETKPGESDHETER